MTGKVGAAIFLFALFCGVYGKDSVPVLIWNSNQAQRGVPEVSALQVISTGAFQAKYLADFRPNNIILFLQDVLSVEDLSSHATELHHVSDRMANSHSVYLPNVENPARIAHDLPAHGYNVVVLEAGTSTAGLLLKQQDKNLVIVKLPSTVTNPSRSRAVQKADEVMESVISKIGDLRDFTVIFTGKAPSVQEKGTERIRIARSLQEDPVDPVYPSKPGYHPTACVLMYLRNNITIKTYNNVTLESTTYIDENDWKEDFGDCHDDSTSIIMKYNKIDIDGNEYPNPSVKFTFVLSSGDWEFESAKLTYHNETQDFSLSEGTRVTGIPKGMSYACGESQRLRSKSEGGKWHEMVIEGFQVQPFVDGQVKFSGAWDCVGFFTVPIWCALLVVLLLLTILFSGMFALSEIKTMDRFDDPKGKPIMVTTAE